VLSEVNASPEHATDVSVAFIKSALHNRIDKWTAVEEHPLVGLEEVLLGDFLATMSVPLPQLSVLYFLHLLAIKIVLDKIFLFYLINIFINLP